jgi:hypothetical protein
MFPTFTGPATSEYRWWNVTMIGKRAPKTNRDDGAGAVLSECEEKA